MLGLFFFCKGGKRKCSICGSLTEFGCPVLQVQIETIDGNVRGSAIEGSRARPAALVRAEGIIQELGELDALLLRRHSVFTCSWNMGAANGQQDLDALGLAVRDVSLDEAASTEQLGFLAVRIGVDLSGAVGTEVAPGVTIAVLGRVVDEGNSGIVDTRVANITQETTTSLTL